MAPITLLYKIHWLTLVGFIILTIAITSNFLFAWVSASLIPSEDFTFTSSAYSNSDVVDSSTQFSAFPVEVASSSQGTGEEGVLVTLNYRIKTDRDKTPDAYSCCHKFTMVQNEGL